MLYYSDYNCYLKLRRVQRMKNKFKTSLLVLLCGLTLSTSAQTNLQNMLPNIGTAGSTTLTIPKEIEMGDYYTRQLRQSNSLIDDPVLTHYINRLGQRLVSAANFPQIPFEFFIVYSNEINAFALFGGNVVIYTGLINASKNESELASVMAHEISHVTQRHLARSMENRKLTSPMTIAAAVGSILIGLINPAAGVGALSSTIAGSQQNLIAFTQAYEQEADRIGIQILYQAGFDPEAMMTFLQKIADQSRFSSKPPEMLLTHPLPLSRITDARSRASTLGSVKVNSSIDYYLAKIRVANYATRRSHSLNTLIYEYEKTGNENQQIAAKYGKALQLFDKKNYAAAANTLDPLLKKQPDNEWFIDLATDIDIERHRLPDAIARLKKALMQHRTSTILQLNLANAYIEYNQFDDAIGLLHRYTHQYPSDINGWTLLSSAYNKQQKYPEEMAAKAEIAALKGNFSEALTLLVNASKQFDISPTNRSRFDSRIDQLRELQRRFSDYK